MTIRQMYKEDSKLAAVLDDVLDAFGLSTCPQKSPKTHYLIRAYIVRAHFRRRRRNLKSVRRAA